MDRAEILKLARSRLGIDIQPWTTDVDGAIALGQRIYPGKDLAHRAYLDWQYRKNPAGEAPCFIGKVGNAVAGSFAIIPQTFQVSGQVVAAGISANTMTDPAFRGQGVFPILGTHVLEKCAKTMSLVLAFPNPFSYKGFLHDLQMKEVGHLPFWVMPLNLSAIGASTLFSRRPVSKVLCKAFHPLANLWRYGFGLGAPSNLWKISEVAGIDAEFGTLWDRVKGDFPIATARTTEYLLWRYSQHPTRKYRYIVARSAQGIEGYVITRSDTMFGLSCGLLVDLFVPGTKKGAAIARALIAHALNMFDGQGIALVASMATGYGVVGRSLARSGFCPVPQRFLPQPVPVLMKWLSAEKPPADLLVDSRWHLTMGDYDVW